MKYLRRYSSQAGWNWAMPSSLAIVVSARNRSRLDRQLQPPHPRLSPRAVRERRHRPHQRVEPIRRAPRREAIEPEVAHLVLERGKTADVLDAALLVERGDRLGAQILAARG